MTITKEYLEICIAESTQKRDSAIAVANGAIAEINTYKKLLSELEAVQPEAPESDQNDQPGV